MLVRTARREAMSKAANMAIIRRFYDEVINRRHLAVLDEMLAPNVEGFKAEGIARASNREDFKRILAFALGTFPECQLTIHDWHTDKDVVVTRWTLCGRRRGEYLGIPGVEQQFRATGRDTFRLVGEQIIEIGSRWTRFLWDDKSQLLPLWNMKEEIYGHDRQWPVLLTA
jgi:predicted ester cyclase